MSPRPTTSSAAAAIACAVCAIAAQQAQAATTFTVRGAGFGHGVGMSQYGAYGFAKQGTGYRSILRHYYSGTSLGSVSGRTVRVLLRTAPSTTFSGAAKFGTKRLVAGTTYSAKALSTGKVRLYSPTGRTLSTQTAPVRVPAAGSTRAVTLGGTALNGRTNGAYRGALELRPAAGGVQVVNAVGLEDYVQGVVPLESPASWPAEALKAQAVAARTYAITTSKAGNGYDQLPTTASQVYGGAGAEVASTNAAVRATAGEVVTYDGKPVVTYFFSTSGGRTEAVETSVLGTSPLPWLKSVEDPYDDLSPKHRWGPIQFTQGAMKSKLGSLVKGTFKGIEVKQRGASPRILKAEVVGTGGRTTVTGATLRAKLGLFDTWAYFTSITTGRPPAPLPADDGRDGGTAAQAAGADRGRLGTVAVPRPPKPTVALRGTVLPARPGKAVAVQRRSGGRWRTVERTTQQAGGRFVARVDQPGRYRVRYSGAAGPTVRVSKRSR